MFKELNKLVKTLKKLEKVHVLKETALTVEENQEQPELALVVPEAVQVTVTKTESIMEEGDEVARKREELNQKIRIFERLLQNRAANYLLNTEKIKAMIAELDFSESRAQFIQGRIEVRSYGQLKDSSVCRIGINVGISDDAFMRYQMIVSEISGHLFPEKKHQPKRWEFEQGVFKRFLNMHTVKKTTLEIFIQKANEISKEDGMQSTYRLIVNE